MAGKTLELSLNFLSGITTLRSSVSSLRSRFGGSKLACLELHRSSENPVFFSKPPHQGRAVRVWRVQSSATTVFHYVSQSGLEQTRTLQHRIPGRKENCRLIFNFQNLFRHVLFVQDDVINVQVKPVVIHCPIAFAAFIRTPTVFNPPLGRP